MPSRAAQRLLILAFQAHHSILAVNKRFTGRDGSDSIAIRERRMEGTDAATICYGSQDPTHGAHPARTDRVAGCAA